MLSCWVLGICITPLLGLSVGVEEQILGEIDIVKEDGNVCLVQWLYKGELKELYDDRICAGWVFHFIDKNMNAVELHEYLNNITIVDICRPDNETPRMPNWNIQEIDVRFKGEAIMSFTHDPYK